MKAETIIAAPIIALGAGMAAYGVIRAFEWAIAAVGRATMNKG